MEFTVNSTHKVEVVEVKLREHPNADSLSIVDVHGGYPCCVRTEDWRDGDLGAFIPPDSVVDVSRPEFAFLAKGTKTRHRVKCVKLRGVQSFGLLMKAPDGAQVGDDVAEHFGVEHYEPEMRGACTGGEAIEAPPALACMSRYDVDSMRRYPHLFENGEMVYVTEKIHGANARYCWLDDKMWCGSRAEWKMPSTQSIWWRALTDEMEAFCKCHPGYVLYGEVYGAVQELRYGLQNKVRFAAFDVHHPVNGYLNAEESEDLLRDYGVRRVPFIGILPYAFDIICDLAEGESCVTGADHIREGVVVKPLKERWHQSIGRVQLKVVGAGYLQKS